MNHETLAEYVTRMMREKSLSGYEIEQRSRPKISQSYVNRIKNGHDKNPSVSSLESLATGLGVPFSELIAVARGVGISQADISHERLATIDFAYDGMPKKKKERADLVIEMLEREIKRIESEVDE